MLQQLVGLIFGGLAIVASDGDIEIGRQQVSAQIRDFLLCRFADHGRVGAFALGQRDGHGREVAAGRGFGSAGSIGVEHVVLRLGGTIHDLRSHVAQVNRLALRNSDDHLLQVFRAAEEASGFDLKLLVVLGKASGCAARVGLLQLRGNRSGGHAISRQPLRVQHHSHLPRQPADDLGLRDIVNLLELVVELAGNLAKLVAAVMLAPQGERHDGHIVDGADLDQRLEKRLAGMRSRLEYSLL